MKWEPCDNRMFYSSKTASSSRFQWPGRSPHCLDSCSWLVLQTLQPTSFPSVADKCVCTRPFMLLLLPQDLVPLKQGLWFDRLPVLSLVCKVTGQWEWLSSSARANDCCVLSSCLCGPVSLHPSLWCFAGVSHRCHEGLARGSVERPRNQD